MHSPGAVERFLWMARINFRNIMQEAPAFEKSERSLDDAQFVCDLDHCNFLKYSP